LQPIFTLLIDSKRIRHNNNSKFERCRTKSNVTDLISFKETFLSSGLKKIDETKIMPG
jgi:hypothetical protein